MNYYGSIELFPMTLLRDLDFYTVWLVKYIYYLL